MDRNKLNLCPLILKDYLMYSESIKSRSSKTVEQYWQDLTLFFKFMKVERNSGEPIPFSDMPIDDIDLDFIKEITITDLYSFLVYCKEERKNDAAARARKVSSLRGFFKYITVNKHLLEKNPAAELDTPKLKKSLPVHLTLEQSLELLKSVDGAHRERDYAILTVFLNCGLRLSELCSLNYNDIMPDGSMKVTGKGNKQRLIYLNNACIDAINEYMKVRSHDGLQGDNRNALFLSSRNQRISNKTVQHIVYTYLEKAGLSNMGFSTHKLRHTAATLMYQHGKVDIRVLKDILGHENLGTTQIYTHVANEQLEKAFNANPLANVKPNK